MSTMLGKHVIVRAARAGVFFGILKEKEKDEVTLTECRKLYYWDGAATTFQLADVGTVKPENCKFTITIPEVTITEIIEIIPCTTKAIKIIKAVKEWKR